MTDQGVRGAAEGVSHGELSGTAPLGEHSVDLQAPAGKENAFAKLMRPKLRSTSSSPSKPARTYKAPSSTMNDPSIETRRLGRDGLVAYTEHPEAFPLSRVVYYNDRFTIINDLFPKSQIHLLILPRDRHYNEMHPKDAFEDPVFLAECRSELLKVRMIVATELQRRHSKYSVGERARNEAMESDDPPAELPPGRDWDKEILSGIHANPSMNHLHIHVLSQDMIGPSMKKPNHYQSFNSDFLVPLEAFPLGRDDRRRHYGSWKDNELICWRCRKNFGRGFSRLLEHLGEEYEQWRRE